MIKENKELLLREICSRLPYGVKCKVWYNDKALDIKCTGIDFYTNTVNLDIPEDDNAKVYIDNIKPYLFPLSSMTEEQKKEYKKICELDTEILVNHPMNGEPFPALYNSQDWLNAHHFDYRGLINKGLAIDASNLNIY